MLMYKQYCFLCDQIYFGYISLSFSHLLKEKGCGIEMPKINENDPSSTWSATYLQQKINKKKHHALR